MSRRFLQGLDRPEQIQTQVLLDLLALNGDSDFSRKHKLSEIRTLADFQRRLPIADYDTFRPYIERLKHGDCRALLGSGNRLLMFTLTSGTTSDAKFIPITQRFLDDYRRGWKVWGINAFDAHPALHQQLIVQLSSDHDQFRTPGGYPCGNISGLVSSMQSPLVKTMYTIPDIVAKISNPEAKYYTALRLSVANSRVGVVMTANPSTLVHLAQHGDKHSESLIRDIADGTLSDQFDIAPAIRARLQRAVSRPDPQRARTLARLRDVRQQLLPRDYWSDLGLLAVWTGGSAAAYLPGVKKFYGDIPIRDHGLSASEGRMTIPFEDGRSDGVLDIGSHFFEFVPEAQHGQPNPTVLAAHELVAGERYYILLTTSSGLYRYDIRDVVQCTGFAGQTPRLTFLNKGSHISSLTGEKISESQVVNAVTSTMAGLPWHFSSFTLTPAWGDPPGYVLLAEARDIPEGFATASLSAQLDRTLQELNCEYGEKRKTGRLAPLRLETLPAGTWHRFSRSRQTKLGGSIEQYKHPCLIPDVQFLPRFLAEYRGPAETRHVA